jgi:glutamate carboxypeptidase
MREELESHLQSLLPAALGWLERMVAINSFSTHPKGINALGDLTAECFAELGFWAERVNTRSPEHGAHLLLHRAGQPGGKRVLLVTHLDTVYPAEEELRNDFRWEPAPSEDRIYGPGTVDIKGGTALIWLTLHGLRMLAPELYAQTHWMVAADATEEVLNREFADVLTQRYPDGADAVLVFEGGAIDGDEFLVVTSRKGRQEHRISASGRGAHAGSKHSEGINAVYLISQVLTEVHQLTDYSAELTVNVATVQGGTVLNRVPHEAFAELEMRAYSPAQLEQVVKRIEQLCADCAVPGAALGLDCLGKSPAWPGDESDWALLRHWQEAAQQMGKRIRITRRGGLSDANYLCHLGPTLDGLGPWGDNAHCSERSADGSKLPEWVAPSSFVPKAALNVLALRSLLG